MDRAGAGGGCVCGHEHAGGLLSAWVLKFSRMIDGRS